MTSPRDTLSSLLHQIRCPRRGPTMGPCSRGCGESARGSLTCYGCLAKDLKQHVDPKLVDQLVATNLASKMTAWAVEDAIDEIE